MLRVPKNFQFIWTLCPSLCPSKRYRVFHRSWIKRSEIGYKASSLSFETNSKNKNTSRDLGERKKLVYVRLLFVVYCNYYGTASNYPRWWLKETIKESQQENNEQLCLELLENKLSHMSSKSNLSLHIYIWRKLHSFRFPNCKSSDLK